MHIMEGQRVTKPRDTRRRHADAFKQALVERSLVPGASVAAIAQEAGINANLLFNWRRLHLQSMASASARESRAPVLLPVTVVESTPTSAAPTLVTPPPAPAARAPVGSIEIHVRGAVVRVRGNVDEASLRTVLRALTSTA
jgi:transposase